MQSRFHFSASISITGIFGDLLAFFIQSPIAFHETAGELTYANRGMHYSGAIRWTPGSLLVEVRGKIR